MIDDDNSNKFKGDWDDEWIKYVYKVQRVDYEGST